MQTHATASSHPSTHDSMGLLDTDVSDDEEPTVVVFEPQSRVRFGLDNDGSLSAAHYASMLLDPSSDFRPPPPLVFLPNPSSETNPIRAVAEHPPLPAGASWRVNGEAWAPPDVKFFARRYLGYITTSTSGVLPLALGLPHGLAEDLEPSVLRAHETALNKLIFRAAHGEPALRPVVDSLRHPSVTRLVQAAQRVCPTYPAPGSTQSAHRLFNEFVWDEDTSATGRAERGDTEASRQRKKLNKSSKKKRQRKRGDEIISQASAGDVVDAENTVGGSESHSLAPSICASRDEPSRGVTIEDAPEGPRQPTHIGADGVTGEAEDQDALKPPVSSRDRGSSTSTPDQISSPPVTPRMPDASLPFPMDLLHYVVSPFMAGSVIGEHAFAKMYMRCLMAERRSSHASSCERTRILGKPIEDPSYYGPRGFVEAHHIYMAELLERQNMGQTYVNVATASMSDPSVEKMLKAFESVCPNYGAPGNDDSAGQVILNNFVFGDLSSIPDTKVLEKTNTVQQRKKPKKPKRKRPKKCAADVSEEISVTELEVDVDLSTPAATDIQQQESVLDILLIEEAVMGATDLALAAVEPEGTTTVGSSDHEQFEEDVTTLSARQRKELRKKEKRRERPLRTKWVPPVPEPITTKSHVETDELGSANVGQCNIFDPPLSQAVATGANEMDQSSDSLEPDLVNVNDVGIVSENINEEAAAGKEGIAMASLPIAVIDDGQVRVSEVVTPNLPAPIHEFEASVSIPAQDMERKLRPTRPPSRLPDQGIVNPNASDQASKGKVQPQLLLPPVTTSDGDRPLLATAPLRQPIEYSPALTSGSISPNLSDFLTPSPTLSDQMSARLVDVCSPTGQTSFVGDSNVGLFHSNGESNVKVDYRSAHHREPEVSTVKRSDGPLPALGESLSLRPPTPLTHRTTSDDILTISTAPSSPGSKASGAALLPPPRSVDCDPTFNTSPSESPHSSPLAVLTRRTSSIKASDNPDVSPVVRVAPPVASNRDAPADSSNVAATADDPRPVWPMLSSSWCLWFSNKAVGSAPTQRHLQRARAAGRTSPDYMDQMEKVFSSDRADEFLGKWKALRRQVAIRTDRVIEPAEEPLMARSEGLGIMSLHEESSFHVYRTGIDPIYEDPMSVKGGKFVLAGNSIEVRSDCI